MRTTVSIDDSVLRMVRQVAKRRRVPLGVAVTLLLREALTPKEHAADGTGLPLMPVQPGASSATLEIVNALRDELP